MTFKAIMSNSRSDLKLRKLGVLDARIHEGGMVVLTGALALLEIKGWDGSRPLTLASAGKPLLSYAVPLVNSARTLGTSTHLEYHTPPI